MTLPFTFWPLLHISAALLAGDIPTAEKLQRLRPFFAPPPGSELRLDPAEIRDHGKNLPPGKLRGFVQVRPPKGTCLTITRSLEEEDVTVCKPTKLSFTLDDMDRQGRLHWSVSTGTGDFGTELSWRVPYRLAIVTPFTKTLNDPPDYKYIAGCKAEKSATGRKITLSLFDGSLWTLRFPDTDTLVPQPDPIPDLAVDAMRGKKSIKEAAAEKEKEGGGEKKEGAEGGSLAATIEKKVEEIEDRAVWAIPARGSFGMNADAFQPYGSVAHGLKGACRYTYTGSDGDEHTGRVECHDTDGFLAVLIPLTCIDGIRD